MRELKSMKNVIWTAFTGISDGFEAEKFAHFSEIQQAA